jgi:glycosyltransferase involved in cell wall biosynthesis
LPPASSIKVAAIRAPAYSSTGKDEIGDVELSVILPVHDEAQSLPVLWEELRAALAAGGWSAEVLFVDDGSRDGSDAIIRTIRARDRRVRLIRLDTHAGVSAAVDAGFRHARGRIIVTMDSDLQNDPRDIAALVSRLDGFDAAIGWRQDRHDPWLKRVSSRIGNAVRSRVLGDSVRDSACGLRAMRRHCLADLPRFSGFQRFIPSLLGLAGHRVLEVPVRHRARRFGRSHFGIRNRALVAFEDLLAVRWMRSRRLRYEAKEDRE